MLAAIGVGLGRGALRPPDPRRRAARPRARPARRAARAGRLRAPARARRAQHLGRGRDHVPRRRDVRPLRPGGHRHADGALGVPDAVHALPARGLPGRPAGDVRVPDGDQRADRRCRSPTRRSTRARAPSPPPATWRKLANGKGRVRRLARACTRTRRETLRTYAHGYGVEVVEVAAARRRHRPRRVGGGDRRATPARSFFQQPELPRRRRGRRGAGGGRQGLAGASSSAPTTRSRSASSSRPASAASTSRVGEGQPLGNRLDFGGPSFGFFAATEAYLRRMPGRIAGETRRRRRPPRLRADAADARAAHPPREGDVEHLHRAGAQRARRASST